jgi:Salmonella virulence plasmid 65kDa B protein
MTLLDRLRRSFAVRLVTFVTFASASMPLSALAAPKVPTPRPADVPPEGAGDGSALSNGTPGLGSLGVPESGGQAAAGALDLASVEPSTGVAHASIPFRLETARGKVQPSLSLQYSSASGQREGGLGWSLALPSIERHNDSGHPLYQDPAPTEALDPKMEDHFTFETKPLVPICLVGGNDVTGAKCEGALSGEQMPSWARKWHYFRLEADTSFARFFWSPDHRTWVVQLKSGKTMEFGTPLDTADAAANGNEVDASIPTLPTFRWRLVRRFDLMGPEVNVIYYRWSQNDPSQPLLYLNEIYDTPLPRAGSGSGWGSSFGQEAFAHHVHLSWAQDDTATPAPGYMPKGVGNGKAPCRGGACSREQPTGPRYFVGGI